MASCSLATTEALPGTMARTKELLPSWHTRSLSRPTTRCSRSLVRRTMVPSLASPVPTSGATWDDGKNEGIITELAYSIAVSPNNPLFTIIGTQDNGTFSRVASTDIWSYLGRWQERRNYYRAGILDRCLAQQPVVHDHWYAGQWYLLSRRQYRHLGADPRWRRNRHSMEQVAGEQ